MKITKILYKGVNKDGVCKSGGAVETKGKIIIGRGEGCPLHDSGCRCSEGYYITIVKPLRKGIVEGLKVDFENKKEYNKFMRQRELTK